MGDKSKVWWREKLNQNNINESHVVEMSVTSRSSCWPQISSPCEMTGAEREADL